MSWSRTWMLLALAGLTQGVGAAEPKDVPDPTRPAAGFVRALPSGMGGPAGKGGAAASAEPSANAASAASVAARAGPALLAIRFDESTGQALALIDDAFVSVGDAVGGATVVAITRHEVTLKGPGGLRKMRLDDGLLQAPADHGGAPKPASKKKRRKETT
jgi:hypothetical protein